VLVSWIMALIKIQALLTIRRQRWLTRQVAVENGEVVRTTSNGSASSNGSAPQPHHAAQQAAEPASEAPGDGERSSQPRAEAPV
jgi:hyaluronan synthase